MNCPKCQSPHPDDAQFCSLCYENFKAKPRSEPALAVAHVDANVGDWTVSGPLLIREEGFYFFIKSFVDRNKAILRQGMPGGLLGAAAAGAVEALSPEGTPPEPCRPRATGEITELFQKVLADAPDIPACRQYFLIPKRDMTRLHFDILGMLCVKTAALSLRIQGAGPKDKLSGFLVMRGYPLDR